MMGLFKRQPAAGTSAKTRTETVPQITDEDLVTCASALSKMEAALLGGSDAGIRRAAQEIAWAGGIRPDGELIHWILEITLKDPGAKPTDRPWWWLTAVSEAAIERSNARLAGRIGFFVHGWHEHVAPNMGLADEEDCGGIKIIPRDAYSKALGLAVVALAPLPGDVKIVTTDEKFVPVSSLLPALSGALLKLEQSGVRIAPGARDAAAGVVSST